jgi:transposase
MIPEKVFEQILALGEGWRVSQTDYLEKEAKIVIRVEETPQLWKSQQCPYCQSKKISGYDHAPERRWRHLNVCQLQSELACPLPRGKCADCQSVYTVRAPWEGRAKGLTQEFEAFALTLMREMPVKKAGEILGETDQRLWRMLFGHVEAAWAQLSWEDVVWIGADEMNRRKGHNYLTVFVDLVAKRVLLAVEGKGAEVWEQFVQQLAAHNGHPRAITQVAIDMSPAYIRGVKDHLGNAAIVFDKFHVVSNTVKAMEEVRRAEARLGGTAQGQLNKTQWLWRKNPENWTEQEARKYERLADKPLVTGLAYAMRLELQNIYGLTSGSRARKEFGRWCNWVREMAQEVGQQLLDPMVKVAQMVEDHLEGILAHWKEGLTTAFLEGLNSLFSATKRKARGYRTTEYQVAMLYFVAGKLEIPCF